MRVQLFLLLSTLRPCLHHFGPQHVFPYRRAARNPLLNQLLVNSMLRNSTCFGLEPVDSVNVLCRDHVGIPVRFMTPLDVRHPANPPWAYLILQPK